MTVVVVGKEGGKGKRKLVRMIIKVNVRVALISYIVFGGLHNARLPLC